MAKDLRVFLEQYEREFPKDIIHVEKEVAARWEATALVAKLEQQRRFPIVIFHKVRNAKGEISPFPLVMNLFASRDRCARVMGSTFETYSLDLARKVKEERRKPEVIGRQDAPVKEVIKKGKEIDLFEMPALVHHGWDPGHYITAGYFTCYDPETSIDNAALHRGWISASDEIRVALSPTTHNSFILSKHEERGEDMRAAYWIGHHPAVCLGAQIRGGFPESHFEAAGAVAGEPLRLVASETLGEDFLMPADAEIVIEGIMPAGERKTEAPFGEAWGYYGPQRLSPYMRVTAVTHRRDAYFHDLFVGHTDPVVGVGCTAVEASLYQAIKLVIPTVQKVYRPPCALPQFFIQIKKTGEGQGKDALLVALSASDLIRQAFVFDEDVNIFDEREVLWAIATRCDLDNGVLIVKNSRTTILDPLGWDYGTTTKMGLDCTKPWGKPFLERFSVPKEVMARLKLEDYLPGAQD